MDHVDHDFYMPPDYKHRWLPMPGGILDDTPIRNGIDDCSGVNRWQCGVIAHYSLFEHLGKGTSLFILKMFTADGGKCYDFGIYDLHHYAYDLWPINLFAAWGHELIAAGPIPSFDEDFLTSHYPKRIKKRIVAVLLC